MSHKNPDILQSVFNKELDIISDWFHMNKLSVNAKKTNFMMFTNKTVDIEQFQMKLAGSEIKHVPSLKFLGVTIDNKLTWKNHLLLSAINYLRMLSTIQNQNVTNKYIKNDLQCYYCPPFRLWYIPLG